MLPSWKVCKAPLATLGDPRIIMRYIALISILLTGCAISYENTVHVSLSQNDEVKAKLLSIMQSIAEKHELVLDESTTLNDNKLGYFGKPYDYYTLEIVEATGGPLVVNFSHEARMSSKTYKHNELEKDFLKQVQAELGSEIIELNYNFIE